MTRTGVAGARKPPGDSRRWHHTIYWNGEPRNPEFNPACLTRVWERGSPGVPDMLGDAYSPDVMERINAITDFDDFRRDLEGGPHGAVHRGVGGLDGDMGLQSSSPNGQFSEHRNSELYGCADANF